MRNIDQRREDSNRPIDIPDINQKVGIENVTFSSADARFLDSNRNRYVSTMPMQMKGLENSEARLMYDMYKTMRGTLLEGGKAWMQSVAAKQAMDDPALTARYEMEARRDATMKEFSEIDQAEVEPRWRSYNRDTARGTRFEKDKRIIAQTKLKNKTIEIEENETLSAAAKTAAKLKLHKEFLDEAGY